jgi:hypothetical protein
VVTNILVSGADCVDALCAAGFRVHRQTLGGSVLVRGPRTLVVPDAIELSAGALDSILAEAELTVDRFIWLLGELPTETELLCAPA